MISIDEKPTFISLICGVIFILIVLVLSYFVFTHSSLTNYKDIPYEEFYHLIQTGKIKHVFVGQNFMTACEKENKHDCVKVLLDEEEKINLKSSFKQYQVEVINSTDKIKTPTPRLYH